MILNGHKVGNDGYSQGLAYGMMSLFSTLPNDPSFRLSDGSAVDNDFSAGDGVIHPAYPLFHQYR
jgi:hypothetical protein